MFSNFFFAFRKTFLVSTNKTKQKNSPLPISLLKHFIEFLLISINYLEESKWLKNSLEIARWWGHLDIYLNFALFGLIIIKLIIIRWDKKVDDVIKGQKDVLFNTNGIERYLYWIIYTKYILYRIYRYVVHLLYNYLKWRILSINVVIKYLLYI